MAGYYDYLVSKRDAVLSTARMSNAARARAMGRQPAYQPAAKIHIITVNCAKPEERIVSTVEPVAAKPAARPETFVTPKHWRSNRGCNPILDAVAIAFHVTLGELLGEKRSNRLSAARFAASRLISMNLKMSTAQIGRTLKRDHTTIMHALVRARGLLDHDADWTARYRAAEHLFASQP